MRKIILYTLLLLPAIFHARQLPDIFAANKQSLFAQATPGDTGGVTPVIPAIPVDTVIISGNDKTKNEVILREIPYTFPDTLHPREVLAIQHRIQNLFLFNQVEVYPIDNTSQDILLIDVKETWYIYPVPILFINERDWDKISYGFQVSHFNFRGMNEKLNVGGWAGYNPSFFLSYYNPWVGRESKFIFGLSLSKRSVENKFFDFDEDHLGVAITLGKRFGLNTALEASVNVRQIKFPKAFQTFLISDSERDIVPQISLQLRHDRRDLYEYPMSGYYLNWQVTRTGFADSQPQFWRWQFDHRLYVRLSQRMSIGGRNLLKLNRGHLPIYDHIFIGYFERIRGYFNRVLTAQNLMLQNLELRISLFPIQYLSWKEAPAFSKFFQGLKYGVSMGFFVDAGTVWDRSEQISPNRLFSGYGGGLHFHVPYINMIRVERAWSDRGVGQWIIDAQVSF